MLGERLKYFFEEREKIKCNTQQSMQNKPITQIYIPSWPVTILFIPFVVVVLPGCFRGMAASYVQRGHKRIILNTEVLLA